jgi:hypothetical protein
LQSLNDNKAICLSSPFSQLCLSNTLSSTHLWRLRLLRLFLLLLGRQLRLRLLRLLAVLAVRTAVHGP